MLFSLIPGVGTTLSLLRYYYCDSISTLTTSAVTRHAWQTRECSSWVPSVSWEPHLNWSPFSVFAVSLFQSCILPLSHSKLLNLPAAGMIPRYGLYMKSQYFSESCPKTSTFLFIAAVVELLGCLCHVSVRWKVPLGRSRMVRSSQTRHIFCSSPNLLQSVLNLNLFSHHISQDPYVPSG